MVIVDLQNILSAESCITADELWVWGDIGEDRKDKFVRKLENCEEGIEKVNIRSKERLTRELVLRQVRLVRDVRDLRDFDRRTMARRRFLLRPHTSQPKNLEVLPW